MMDANFYKCAKCGKVFYWTNIESYIYKKSTTRLTSNKPKTIYFCGWNCMRKYEKEREKQGWHRQI